MCWHSVLETGNRVCASKSLLTIFLKNKVHKEAMHIRNDDKWNSMGPCMSGSPVVWSAGWSTCLRLMAQSPLSNFSLSCRVHISENSKGSQSSWEKEKRTRWHGTEGTLALFINSNLRRPVGSCPMVYSVKQCPRWGQPN